MFDPNFDPNCGDNHGPRRPEARLVDRSQVLILRLGGVRRTTANRGEIALGLTLNESAHAYSAGRDSLDALVHVLPSDPFFGRPR